MHVNAFDSIKPVASTTQAPTIPSSSQCTGQTDDRLEQLTGPRPAVCPFASLGAAFVRTPSVPAAPVAASSTARDLKNASAQQADLYERVRATAYQTKPKVTWQFSGMLGGLNLLRKIHFDKTFRAGLENTFASSSDVHPTRAKVFHPFGVVGAATFEADATTPFTGIFKSGAPAIVRLSLAADVASYTPGFAIKLFVDNKPSLNVHSVPGLDPQESHDFFARDFNTWVDLPKTQGPRTLQTSLDKVVAGGDKLSIARLAEQDTQGTSQSNPVAPARLLFRGVKHLDSTDSSDFRDALSESFSPGDALFDVFAVDAHGAQTKAGRVVLTQPLVASRFGDEELHFQHNPPIGE